MERRGLTNKDRCDRLSEVERRNRAVLNESRGVREAALSDGHSAKGTVVFAPTDPIRRRVFISIR